MLKTLKKKPKRKATGPSESDLQTSCVKWFDYSYPKLRINLFSIPNEGVRTIANGSRMKAMGRRKGVADMFLASYCREDFQSFHGLFIEFKIGSGKQSVEQRVFQHKVEEQGYRYAVIRSFDEFEKMIKEYLNG